MLFDLVLLYLKLIYIEFLSRFEESGGVLFDCEKCPDFIDLLLKSSDTVINLERNKDLRISRLRKYDTDILFCVNEGEDAVDTVIKEKVTAVLDAETGKTESFDKNEFRLSLEPRKSLYLVIG